MKAGKAAGRPRSFDAEKALDAAMKVFWRKGYEGASLSDLTRAMGINRPSLYAAFGDKQALFDRALKRYDSGPASYVRAALQEPTARRVAERLLTETAELLGDPRNPRGCLGVQSALACGQTSEPVREQLIAYRRAGEALIRKRFERAQAEGDLPPDANPADLAAYITTVIRGMAVDAASGMGRNALRRVAQTALRAWPKDRSQEIVE
jgi:AcrR family transcriptional regulator